MQYEEQRLIDGLFSRLKQVQDNSTPRDAAAESVIAQHIQAQPTAPYYMAQSILIQEAAIKQLNERIQALESEAAQLRATKPSSGGFLAGLFGGGQSQPQPQPQLQPQVNNPIPGTQNAPNAGYGAPQQSPVAAAPARNGSSFMAGALQTAAGVAGGVVLGNMLTHMFSGTHPQEIVNIIEEPPVPTADVQNTSFLPQDGGVNGLNNDLWDSNKEFNHDDFASNDSGNDDFNMDDDDYNNDDDF